MKMRPECTAPHLERFAAMLDAAFRAHGAAGLPARFLAAVQEVPRHGFVHRFRAGDSQLRDFEAAPEESLKLIYSDRVLAHVAADGEALASTNSQPSFVLWLVYLLDVQPGQNILEIGSGSGWLAGIMAHLVGSPGHVTGMEIIAPLAAQSRADLAACGLTNVTILAQDGALGCPAAPFDRVIITAGVWDLPAMLFEQVAPEGLVIVPVELSFSNACHVVLLRREAERFIEIRSMRGWFVPLTGPSQMRTWPRADEDVPAPGRLAIYRSEQAPAPGAGWIIEPRGASTLVWIESKERLLFVNKK
jgi:protein-L-isoaspartate(D-aspartate) O-methyltransferase